jgi:hypothetical protein
MCVVLCVCVVRDSSRVYGVQTSLIWVSSCLYWRPRWRKEMSEPVGTSVVARLLRET